MNANELKKGCMKELYQKYIEDKSPAWSPASVRSEGLRLNRIIDQVENTKEGPARLWAGMGHYNGNTRVTVWGRLVCFIDWAIENEHIQGPNYFAKFRAKNPRAFRNQYIRRPCKLKFDEIVSRLNQIPDELIRNKAKQLYFGAMRFSESYTLTSEDYVIGKGGKIRKIYLPDDIKNAPMMDARQYRALLRWLKKVGIPGPHKLRSARMMNYVDLGANPFQLKKIAGWASLGTAESYIEAREEDCERLSKMRLEPVS